MTSSALLIWIDNRIRLWYNTPMTTATETTTTRIIPRGLYSEHAYAFGYLRGQIQSLIAATNCAYYSSPESRLLELETKIAEIDSTLKQMESEMYTNDSE